MVLLTQALALLVSAVGTFAATSGLKYTTEALADEITILPGAPKDLHYRQFSGYLNIGHGREIFYWYVESLSAPSTDPIMLWTNGGPGCAGLSGFLSEMGPLIPNAGGSLEYNENTWSRLANMVFVDIPAGVGFSTTNHFIKYDDEQTAQDNYQLLLEFMKRYPHLNKNDLFLTSESYGGHYLPTLALKIVQNGGLNFKGFAVGNPLTYMPYRDYGQWGTYWNHQLLPKPLWDSYLKNGCKEDGSSSVCTNIVAKIQELTSHVDPYALDFPKCQTQEANGRHERFSFLSTIARSKAHAAGHENVHLFNNEQLSTILGGNEYFPKKYIPCTANYVAEYLNRDDVKEAIHAKPEIKWEMCSAYINTHYDVKSTTAPMMPIYNELIDKYDLKLMIYSGDDDSICSTLGTQEFIWDLGYNVTEEWKPWLHGGDVAGYTVAFEGGLRLTTIHGGGHMVPATRPKQSYELLRKFLSDDW